MTLSTQRSPLVLALVELARKDDRAALAALRTGLRDPVAALPAMAPYVERYINQRHRGWDHDCHYLLAALFGAHPNDVPSGTDVPARNMGHALRRVTDQRASGSLEKRFQALLAAHRDDLGVHLRHAISLLHAGNEPLDWDRLLRDLRAWDAPDRYVQRAWARAYWGGQTTSLVPTVVSQD